MMLAVGMEPTPPAWTTNDPRTSERRALDKEVNINYAPEEIYFDKHRFVPFNGYLLLLYI